MRIDFADVAEPPAEVPPPDYAAPPDDSAPSVALARPRRNLRPIMAGVVIAIVAAFIGYAVAGYSLASSRLTSAQSTYNAVVLHQNAITEEINAFDSKVATANSSDLSTVELKLNQTAYAELVSQSQAAQPTITADDASLAAAQAGLRDSSWLTVLNFSSLDQALTRIGHERTALASARTITTDLIQLGTFYLSFYDSLIDLNALGAKAQAADFPGMASVISTLESDIAKATQQSSAPGLPPEMKQFLADFHTLAVDNDKFVAAAVAGDTSTAQADATVVQADAAKLDSYDFDRMATEIKAFYQPLIDAFNSEISKANNA